MESARVPGAVALHIYQILAFPEGNTRTPLIKRFCTQIARPTIGAWVRFQTKSGWIVGVVKGVLHTPGDESDAPERLTPPVFFVEFTQQHFALLHSTGVAQSQDRMFKDWTLLEDASLLSFIPQLRTNP